MRNNSKKYESRNPLQRFLIRRFLEKTADLLKNLPPGPVLEAGCGEGYVLDYLSRNSLEGRKLTGADLDESALKAAAARLAGVDLRRASVYSLPFTAKAFECVLLLEVLEHLERPEEALKEAARVGRSALISVPHEPWFQTANFLRGKNLRRLGNDPEHIQHWGTASFRRLLAPYGEIRAFSAPFPWVMARIDFK